MKFAAISDIHGNYLALEAVLADIKQLGITQIVNLGDHFGGPLDAGRTADILLAQTNMLSIRGNHDRALLELPVGQMGTWDGPAYDQLSKEHMAWVAALPATATLGADVFLCHGNPLSDSVHWLDWPNDKTGMSLQPIEKIEETAKGIEFPTMLCGHSHVPRMVQLADGRKVINPGSVGCHGFLDTREDHYTMHNGNAAACYATFEKQANDWLISFRHVPYDHMAMAELARSKGSDDWASALTGGWIR